MASGDLYSMQQQYYTNALNYQNQQAQAQKLGGYSSMASSFAGIIGSLIDYQSLKADLGNYYVQADQVELQAQQRANQLREQFNTAVGSYTVGAAQRGISVNSGSVRSNVEASAIAMGKDIQKAQENASMQAKALRTQAQIKKKQGKAQMYSGIAQGITSMATTMAGGM